MNCGFKEGGVCSKVNDPKIHRGCKMAKMFHENKAQVDRVIRDRIRGWIPVKDYPELTIHFTVMIPEE